MGGDLKKVRCQPITQMKNTMKTGIKGSLQIELRQAGTHGADLGTAKDR